MVKLEETVRLQKKAQDQIKKLVRYMIELGKILKKNMKIGAEFFIQLFESIHSVGFAVIVQGEDAAEARGQTDAADRRHQHLHAIVSQLESRWTHITLFIFYLPFQGFSFFWVTKYM